MYFKPGIQKRVRECNCVKERGKAQGKEKTNAKIIKVKPIEFCRQTGNTQKLNEMTTKITLNIKNNNH